MMTPQLNFDFVSAVLDPRITFSRADNTATRINSNGFVEAVNADIPRFDYDHVTLVCKGLLIEKQSTNLIKYSNGFSEATWLKGTSNGTAAPVVTKHCGIRHRHIVCRRDGIRR